MIVAVLACLVLVSGILWLVKGCAPAVEEPPVAAPLDGESAENAATGEDSKPTEEPSDLPASGDNTPPSDPPQNNITQNNITQNNTTQNNTTQNNTTQNNITQNNTTQNNTTQNNTTQNNTTQNNTTQNNTTQNNTTTNPTGNGTTPTPPSQGSDDTPTQNQPTQTPAVTQPSYTYVDATNATAYPDWYSTIHQVQNAVVITRVNHVAADGVYVVPDTLDGKKVVAIMPGAFGDAAVSGAVRSVTLPTSVRTIWNDAFKDCIHLKDLYLKTPAVEIYTDAFPAVDRRSVTLTIHCQRDCRNLNFYYYRSIAPDYGAVYAEWNG